MKATEGGFICGSSMRRKDKWRVEVTHLLYVDDIIIFCEINEEQLM